MYQQKPCFFFHMWSARVSLPCRLSWQTFYCCSVQGRALAKVMSTFLLIQELCKLFTLKPETRWNWPGFSSKLIFWPDLPKEPQRFRHSVQVPPEQPRSRAVPGPCRTLGGQPEEGVCEQALLWEILIPCFLIDPFPFPLNSIGSPKPTWVKENTSGRDLEQQMPS